MTKMNDTKMPVEKAQKYSKAWLAGILETLILTSFVDKYKIIDNSNKNLILFLDRRLTRHKDIFKYLRSNYGVRGMKTSLGYLHKITDKENIIKLIKDIQDNIKSLNLREYLARLLLKLESDLKLSEQKLSTDIDYGWYSGIIDRCGILHYNKDLEKIELYLLIGNKQIIDQINKDFGPLEYRYEKPSKELSRALHISYTYLINMPYIWVIQDLKLIYEFANICKNYPILSTEISEWNKLEVEIDKPKEENISILDQDTKLKINKDINFSKAWLAGILENLIIKQFFYISENYPILVFNRGLTKHQKIYNYLAYQYGVSGMKRGLAFHLVLINKENIIKLIKDIQDNIKSLNLREYLTEMLIQLGSDLKLSDNPRISTDIDYGWYLGIIDRWGILHYNKDLAKIELYLLIKDKEIIDQIDKDFGPLEYRYERPSLQLGRELDISYIYLSNIPYIWVTQDLKLILKFAHICKNYPILSEENSKWDKLNIISELYKLDKSWKQYISILTQYL
jgi:hypothetical protein